MFAAAQLSRLWGKFSPLAGSLLGPLFGANEQRCVVCGCVHQRRADGLPACSACLAFLPPRRGGFCPACAELHADESLPLSLCGACLKQSPPWRSLTFYGEYAGPLRGLVLRCKFRHDAAAARLLALLLFSRLAPILESWPPEARETALVAPMPLHPRRLLQRGANQCVELARALRLPMRADCLARVRSTPPQRGLSRRERLRNVARAFEAKPLVAGRHILLLDDVLTTGATMAQAAQCLLDSGAAEVHCAVIARVRLRPA